MQLPRNRVALPPGIWVPDSVGAIKGRLAWTPKPPMLGVPTSIRARIQAAGQERMDTRRNSFDYEDLLACGRGELFGEGPQLPLPPMLMFDRISEIAEAGGEYGKGL